MFIIQTGDTALIKACERGYGDIVRLLLSSGADINQQNLVGSAPLQHISRMTNKLNIVDQLLTYKDLNIDQATHKVSVWLLCQNFSFDLLGNMFYHLIFAII